MMILLFAYLNIIRLAHGHLSMEKPDEHWRPGIGIDVSIYKSKQPQVNEVQRYNRNSLMRNKSDGEVSRYSTQGWGREGPVQKIPDDGIPAEEGQFPWAAALFIDDAWFCEGSLISDGHLLTSAHCLDGASFIDILLGSSQSQGFKS